MTTFIHKYKCRSCGLHFVLYSWQEERPPPHCPECGEQGGFIKWFGETDQQIFELVPGDTPIAGMT